MTPQIISENQLNETSLKMLNAILPLFPVFQSFLKDNMDFNGGIYNSVYYAFFSNPMFVQYPAYKSGILTNWKRINDSCKYFESGKMDYYDAR